MNGRKKLLFLIMIFITLSSLFSQTTENLSKGEKLFKENKPKEAVQVLENEILNGMVSANTYNFLGLGYYQLGDYAKSIDAFNRGIEIQPSNIKILSFNQGNTYYAMKDYSSAVNCFTKSLKNDPEFYDALLNRANSLLMGNQLIAAKSDYEEFVDKCPDDIQKNQIERLIQALTEEIARREEEERLLREQNKALWEEIDPSIEDAEADEILWEKIDADIDENDVVPGIKWEGVDATIEEHQEQKKSVNWEDVDASITEQENSKHSETWEDVDEKIPEHKEPLKIVDWEQVENNSSQLNTNKSSKDEKLMEDDSSENIKAENDEWEKLDEKLDRINEFELSAEKLLEDYLQNWENLSEEEALELKRLEQESRIEYEKWLEEQSLLRQKKAEEELQRLQQKSDAERLEREKLLEEVMRAEESRRKKLLEDVANSLQNGSSTNMSSGTEDLIEYDLEGELD